MALRPEDKARVSAFLGQLLNGAAELGFGALPILALYKRAQDEQVDFWQLLLADPAMSDRLVRAMRQRAGELPEAFVSGLKLVVQAHGEAKALQKMNAKPAPSRASVPGDDV